MKKATLIGAALILGCASYASAETAKDTTAPTVVNRPPVVTITAPAANSTVTIAGFTIRGTASDPAGNPAGIREVRLTGKVGTTTTVFNGPATYDAARKSWSYRASGNGLRAGNAVSVTAVAIDLNGARSLSRAVRLTVGHLAGDSNGNGRVEYADAIALLNYLFQGGPRPTGNPDANGDGRTDISDSIRIFQNNLQFGDFNGSGTVDVDDVIAMLMRIAQNSPATTAQLACCDADGNGQLTGEDAALILQNDRRTQSR